MTYLNITAYHFCLRFFIYSTCTTLHTQLENMPQKGKILKKLKGKRPPFPPFVPSFLHFAIMLIKPPCFGAQLQMLVAYPQYTSIIDMVKREIDMEKSRPPFFLTFPLYLTHCPLCPAKTPCFGPQTGINKDKNRPLFSSTWWKERLIWEKAAPFFLTFPLYLKHCPRCPVNPPVMTHNEYLQWKSRPPPFSSISSLYLNHSPRVRPKPPVLAHRCSYKKKLPPFPELAS